MPKVGAKLFIPISEKTPYGFLGRVKSVKDGDPIKVFTEALPLEEAFDNLFIDTTMNVMDRIEGVFDSEGNPIQYEQIDSTLTESSMDVINTRAGGYWEGGLIKFPFRIADKETGSKNSSRELVGTIYVELKNFDFNIDIANNEIESIDIKADPAFRVVLSDETKLKTPDNWEKSKLIGYINCAPITIPTPIALMPIILRPKLYLYLVYGATGEITASISLQYQCSFKAEMHYRHGQWNNLFHNNGPKNENPWVITSFDVNGELYVGSKMGILVGIYSATTGIGVNVTPKFSLGAEASLSTENLLDLNPQVELAAKWSGDLYFKASLFKRPIVHYSFATPEYVVWSEKLYLLPQFLDFTVTGESNIGKISYKIDNHYFLSLFGAKAGTKVYESDGKTEFNTYYPAPIYTDNEGNKHHNVEIYGLPAGNTYYAAPVCTWLEFTWESSQKVRFETEDNEEKRRLIEFYNSTDGDNWKNNTNWCSNKPLNQWYGVALDDEGHVESIDLCNNALKGDAHIHGLSYLKELNLSLNELTGLDIRDAQIDEISLDNCIVEYGDVRLEGISIITISNNEAIGGISCDCESLEISNCDFGSNNYSILSGRAQILKISDCNMCGVDGEACEATVYNCYMHHCGIRSDYLTFESSTTYDTWFAHTSKRLNIINSYCSTICGTNDFNDDTIIHFHNATLWRSNWDEESKVTLSCTITGAEWDSLFER